MVLTVWLPNDWQIVSLTTSRHLPTRILTHCGLVTPYGDIDLDQHWLAAPSHYLNQCWVIISSAQWYSSGGYFTGDYSAINHRNLFENYLPQIPFKAPRAQCANILWSIDPSYRRGTWSTLVRKGLSPERHQATSWISADLLSFSHTLQWHSNQSTMNSIQ